MRAYRFYNGQRYGVLPVFAGLLLRRDIDRVRHVCAHTPSIGIRDILTVAVKSTISAPAPLCCIAPRSRLYPAGILRFCPPGLAVALILDILSPLALPSPLPPSPASPSLALPALLSPLGLPISTSSLFLLLGAPARYAHTLGGDVTLPTRGRIQTSAPSSFLGSLRPLSARAWPENRRRLKGAVLTGGQLIE